MEEPKKVPNLMPGKGYRISRKGVNFNRCFQAVVSGMFSENNGFDCYNFLMHFHANEMGTRG